MLVVCLQLTGGKENVSSFEILSFEAAVACAGGSI